MRKSQSSFLTPLLLKIVEPDEEEKFERNGHRRWDGGSIIKKDNSDGDCQAQIFK